MVNSRRALKYLQGCLDTKNIQAESKHQPLCCVSYRFPYMICFVAGVKELKMTLLRDIKAAHVDLKENMAFYKLDVNIINDQILDCMKRFGRLNDSNFILQKRCEDFENSIGG